MEETEETTSMGASGDPVPTAPRRLAVIANPKAGAGRADAAVEAIRQRLDGSRELEVYGTDAPGHAREIAASLDPERYEAIGSVGGDGTLHEVVNGLLDSARGSKGPFPTPLWVIPSGSGNSMALDLGYRTLDEAIDLLDRGTPRPVDIARLVVDGEVLYSVNVITWGASARITRRAEGFRWARGQRYNLASVAELILLDRSRDPEGQLLGVASLTRYSGRGMMLAPRAVLDDGKIDLVGIRTAGRLALARVLASVFSGAHVGSPLVSYDQREHHTVTLEPGSELVVDGELVPAREVEITVLPRHLRLLSR